MKYITKEASIRMNNPNIILVNCDDLGYGDLGCYGSTVNKTPTLDKLAKEGTLFTDFYMASAVCSPSRGAMITGCYPPRIGFGEFGGWIVLYPGDPVGLNPSETTIAKMLRENGYRTKIIGKWHCGDQLPFMPLNHGFDEYYGLPYSNDMGRQAGKRMDKGFPPLPLVKDNEVIQQQPDQRALTERYVEQSLDFITRSKDTPFFLYLAHMHTHLPLYAAERFVQDSQNGDYGACVAAVDWAMECILHKLDELGLDNTLIIFTSDNGSRGDNGASNAPLRGTKNSTWEGGMRVPCIMHWPGKIPAGRVCDNIFSSLDFMPTIATMCNIIKPYTDNEIDGLDLTDMVLDNPNAATRNDFIYYYKNNLEAVRVGEWKLHIRKYDEEVKLLYRLSDDISESDNLYDANPDIVKNLNQLADRYKKDLGDDATGIEGKKIRPKGRITNASPLTTYDENHPYIIAMYDKPEAG